jgi:hypothetical protein
MEQGKEFSLLFGRTELMQMFLHYLSMLSLFLAPYPRCLVEPLSGQVLFRALTFKAIWGIHDLLIRSQYAQTASTSSYDPIPQANPCANALPRRTRLFPLSQRATALVLLPIILSSESDAAARARVDDCLVVLAVHVAAEVF